jgi:nucleotide-binding universal stress UspA family protein
MPGPHPRSTSRFVVGGSFSTCVAAHNRPTDWLWGWGGRAQEDGLSLPQTGDRRPNAIPFPIVILIAYDGSEDARAAIEQAAKLWPGQQATVVSVWEPFAEVIAHASTGFAPGMADYDEIDAASEKLADDNAREGAELASTGGLEASGLKTSQTTTIAEAILAAANEVGAQVIVVGTRGLTGVKSLLLGSVSHAVVHHADVPVLVVPSPRSRAD